MNVDQTDISDPSASWNTIRLLDRSALEAAKAKLISTAGTPVVAKFGKQIAMNLDLGDPIGFMTRKSCGKVCAVWTNKVLNMNSDILKDSSRL